MQLGALTLGCAIPSHAQEKKIVIVKHKHHRHHRHHPHRVAVVKKVE